MMLQWCNILSWAGFSVRSRVWPQRFDPIAVTWHLQSSTASSLKATAFETTGQTSVKARIRQNSTQERITCYTACQYRPSATLPVRRHWATCLCFKARNINRNFNNPGGNGRSVLCSEYIYIYIQKWVKKRSPCADWSVYSGAPLKCKVRRCAVLDKYPMILTIRVKDCIARADTAVWKGNPTFIVDQLSCSGITAANLMQLVMSCWFCNIHNLRKPWFFHLHSICRIAFKIFSPTLSNSKAKFPFSTVRLCRTLQQHGTFSPVQYCIILKVPVFTPWKLNSR